MGEAKASGGGGGREIALREKQSKASSLRSQKKSENNGLEGAMTKAIKEQAKRKKYTWN